MHLDKTRNLEESKPRDDGEQPMKNLPKWDGNGMESENYKVLGGVREECKGRNAPHLCRVLGAQQMKIAPHRSRLCLHKINECFLFGILFLSLLNTLQFFGFLYIPRFIQMCVL